MRSRTTFFALLLTTGLFIVPAITFAQGIPFFGPIIPGSDILGNTEGVCPASWGMVVVVINRIIAFMITIAIVFVAPLMIAYSGFLYVVNPVNPEGRSEANKVLRSTVIGIVIALSGWMVVDAIMAVLYNPGNAGGTWMTIIRGNTADMCLPQKGALPGAGLTQAGPVTSVTVVPSTGLTAVTAFSCKNAASCQVSAPTNVRLNQMKANLGAAASQYQITETGVNTSVTHASGTNNLDMSCYGPCSSAQVKAAITAWPGSVKYETASKSDYDAMIAAGVPAEDILGPSWFTGKFTNGGECSTGAGHCITAPHMSLNS